MELDSIPLINISNSCIMKEGKIWVHIRSKEATKSLWVTTWVS